MLRRTSALVGLDRTILLMAATHFAVDGYSNIYAPLLPLLIPRLGLSLAAAGTLTMCFQIAASVSQLGFGHARRPVAARVCCSSPDRCSASRC